LEFRARENRLSVLKSTASPQKPIPNIILNITQEFQIRLQKTDYPDLIPRLMKGSINGKEGNG
jgi:hypothetical protein